MARAGIGPGVAVDAGNLEPAGEDPAVFAREVDALAAATEQLLGEPPDPEALLAL